MKLVLRRANSLDVAFCESLSRCNMATYRATRGVDWDPDRFRASWAEFENLMIQSGQDIVGMLRFTPEHEALGLRDLQILSERQVQGIGSWAVREAQSIAFSRRFPRLQLRVYAENPARALYARLGFETISVVDGTVHMAWVVAPRGAVTTP